MAKQRDTRGLGRKGGFKSFGSNVPQNAYKGKVEKIKAGLIHNAKVKRAYYRTLKKEEKEGILAPKYPILDDSEKPENDDLGAMHPSRSQAIRQITSDPDDTKSGKKSKKPARRKLTLEEKAALVEEKRRQAEQNQKEREKKIKLREKKRRDLRKMTTKGQPVMKPRLENLLGKVKQVMKDT